MTDSIAKRYAPLAGLLLVCGLSVAATLRTVQLRLAEAKRVACMSNLAQLGTAMRLYAKEHGGSYPSGFKALTPYATSPSLYVCPCTGHRPGELTLVDRWTDYVSFPGLTTTEEGNRVLAFCRPRNHGDRGTHVLRADGAVQWLALKEFILLMEGRVPAEPVAGQHMRRD